MKIEKLIEIMKSGTLNIPYLFMHHYKILGMDLDSLLLLSYLFQSNQSTFDCRKAIATLRMDESTLLNSFNQLVEKDLVSIQVIKNGKGVMDEVVSLEPFFQKLALILIGEEPKEKDGSIYVTFEQEFGRTLSPTEYEIINSWLDNHYSQEMIVHALKEAVFSGVSNLRYIDKILFEWDKKGYKKPDDVIKMNKPKESKKVVDIPNYNWLDDHE